MLLKDNIKRLRKKSNMSQADLAESLSVVRQTVSKWENGLSVPDAEMVMKIAQLFHVSVNEVLGVELNDPAEELERTKAILEEKSKNEQRLKLINKKRGLILLWCFGAVFFALAAKNQIVSLCLIGICLIAALLILYRNMPLLTGIITTDIRSKAMKATTIFDAAILLIGIILAILTGIDVVEISDWDEKILAMVVISIVMVFSGIVSPRLPFNRYTGLRLPWTVQDEETWNVAHRVLGVIALPTVLLYIAGAVTIDNFEAVTLAAVLVWIGLPSVVSFVFYYKKHKRN